MQATSSARTDVPKIFTCRFVEFIGFSGRRLVCRAACKSAFENHDDCKVLLRNITLGEKDGDGLGSRGRCTGSDRRNGEGWGRSCKEPITSRAEPDPLRRMRKRNSGGTADCDQWGSAMSCLSRCP